MIKTTAIGFAPANTVFDRLLATIERVLMASAKASARIGDVPYFGL